ncbi:hypothetical protein JTB14_024698 [Gonioctena quinquepunctata]|nr:hypothetical protein JTB14_024698 [Gonioctena quinquepunctata]
MSSFFILKLPSRYTHCLYDLEGNFLTFRAPAGSIFGFSSEDKFKQLGTSNFSGLTPIALGVVTPLDLSFTTERGEAFLEKLHPKLQDSTNSSKLE